VFLYPIIGLMAVGNVIFALLWLLNPVASGPAGEGGGRRVEARIGRRVVKIAEGIGIEGPTKGFETRVASEEFEELTKALTRLTQSKRGAEQAEAFFRSEAGRDAEPALTLAFPRRATGMETLEVYAIDARRQLCYCRHGRSGEPLAVKLANYQKVAKALSGLAGAMAGSLSVPYYTQLDETLRAKLAKLDGPLLVTTVSSDPRQYLLQLLSNPIMGGGGVELEQPDPATLTATVQLPDDQAMTRGLAEAMARASEKVTARHLDFGTQAAAVREFARSIRRSVSDIQDSLVLQYRDRIRPIPNTDMLERQQTGSLIATATSFEGDKVVAKALDGLLAQRGLLYFADGHGERRIADTSSSGLSRPAEQLKAHGFRAEPLDLTNAKAIPEDCQVLVIAGPRKAYGSGVENAIARYVEAGGNLAVMFDPPDGAPVLAALLKGYGITLADPKKEIPAAQLRLDPKLAMARGWTREPIVFFSASALLLKQPAEKKAHELFAIANAIEREGIARSNCVVAGVRPVAGAKGPKILAFGDVDAFTNQSLTGWPGSFFGMPGRVVPLPGNVELLIDALSWLAE
jgi:hypothetical protein